MSRSGNSRPLHQSSATYLTVPERSSSSNHSYQNGYAASPPVPDNSFNSSSGYEEVFSQPQQQLPQHEQQLPLQQQQQHEQQLPLQQQQHEQQLPLQQQQHEQQLPLQQQQQHSDYPTHYSPSVIQTVPYLSPSQPVKEASPSGSAFPSGGGVEEPLLYTRPCQGSRGTTSSAGVGTTGGGGTSTINGSSERDPVARNAGRGEEMLRGGGGGGPKNSFSIN